MSDPSKFTYYEITGGPVMAAKDASNAQLAVFKKYSNALKKEFGAKSVFADLHGIDGFGFEKEPDPATWCRVGAGAPRNCWRPRVTTKEGKRQRDRLRAPEAAYPDVWWFMKQLGLGRLSLMQGMRLQSLAFIEELGRWILAVPINDEGWVPPAEGSRLIPLAEYFQLRSEQAAFDASLPAAKEIAGVNGMLRISIDRGAKSWAVFNQDFTVVKDFTGYSNEAWALQMAMQWCRAAGDDSPEVVYPSITSVRTSTHKKR